MAKTKLLPKEQPKKDILSELLKINIEPEIKDVLISEEILKLIFKSYEIIEKIEEQKIDDIEGKKMYLQNFKNIIDYVQKTAAVSKVDNLDIEFLEKLKEKVNKYVNNNDIVNLDINECKVELNKINQMVKSLKTKEKHQPKEIFSIKEIDDLYVKLYDAYSQKDKKLITLYRGRIINLLKQKDDIIESKYQEISLLDKINSLLNDNLTTEIIDLIKQSKDSEIKKQLEILLNEPKQFPNNFKKLYQAYQVEKILFYKQALNIELKQQGKLLDERYEREFLDKKVTLFNNTRAICNFSNFYK